MRMRQSRSKVTRGVRPVTPIRRRLKVVWIIWLLYRMLAMPVLISIMNDAQLDIIGGVVWQSLWLIPAFVLSPWMTKGKSAYALLLASMITLIYFGASGVVLFTHIYAKNWSSLWIYVIDTVLLLLINIWLFQLLKRLPSMNNPVNHA